MCGFERPGPLDLDRAEVSVDHFDVGDLKEETAGVADRVEVSAGARDGEEVLLFGDQPRALLLWAALSAPRAASNRGLEGRIASVAPAVVRCMRRLPPPRGSSVDRGMQIRLSCPHLWREELAMSVLLEDHRVTE